MNSVCCEQYKTGWLLACSVSVYTLGSVHLMWTYMYKGVLKRSSHSCCCWIHWYNDCNLLNVYSCIYIHSSFPSPLLIVAILSQSIIWRHVDYRWSHHIQSRLKLLSSINISSAFWSKPCHQLHNYLKTGWCVRYYCQTWLLLTILIIRNLFLVTFMAAVFM